MRGNERETLSRNIHSTRGAKTKVPRVSQKRKYILFLFFAQQAAWQEVILVTQHDGVTTQGVVINRPAATSANAQLSAAIVAALESDEGADRLDVQEFDAAFGDRCAAYVGAQPAPPLLLLLFSSQ